MKELIFSIISSFSPLGNPLASPEGGASSCIQESSVVPLRVPQGPSILVAQRMSGAHEYSCVCEASMRLTLRLELRRRIGKNPHMQGLVIPASGVLKKLLGSRGYVCALEFINRN